MTRPVRLREQTKAEADRSARLTAIDALIAERRASIAKLEHRIATCDALTLIGEGAAMQRALDELHSSLPKLIERRTRIFAGLEVDDPKPSRASTPKASTPRPAGPARSLMPRAERSAAFDALALNPEDEDAYHLAHRAAFDTVLEMRRALAPASDTAVAYTQGVHSANDQILASLLKNAFVVRRQLERQIATLAAQVERLQNDPERGVGLHDAGGWKPDKHYARGAVVSHDGSAWIARADNCGSKPPGEAWRLLVKKGRDAREFDAQPFLRLIDDRMADLEKRLTITGVSR